MGYFKILSDGDKLKSIRKKYNLKQEEISGNDITRNLISEIETNKAVITKNTAEIIIKNLKQISVKRHFEVSETIDYLLENKRIQAIKIADSYIDELKTLFICKDDSFVNTLREVEEFLNDCDVKDKQIAVYELAGDYFYTKNEIYKSVVYYEKELTLVSKMSLSKTLLTILRKLSMMYTYVNKYQESIECCESALTRFLDLSRKDSIIFRFNIALCYKKLNKFEKALSNIEKAEELVDKSNDIATYINILINKSNCLYRLKSYNDALNLLNKVLDLVDRSDIEKQILVYINIISNYIALKNTDKVNEKLNIILENLKGCTLSNEYGSEIYFEIGKVYKYLKSNEIEEEYYLKALNSAEKQKSYTLVNDILYDLIELYNNSNDIEKMNRVKSKVFEISSKRELINEKVMFKLISFYSQNDIVVKKVADFSLQFLQ